MNKLARSQQRRGSALDLARVPKTAELVAAELRRRIVRGDLGEGDNLPPESALIEEFGISRPTMREAFRILETEQLISVSRGSRGGARVHMPEVEVVARYAGLYLQARRTTVRDVHDARLLVEPPAARLLAARRPRHLIEELRDQISRIESQIDDAEAYSHHAADFHLRVIEGSGNETLTLLGHVMHEIWEAHLLNVVGTGYDVDKAKLGVRSEKKLLDLVEAGDDAGAEQHLTSHLKRSARIIFKTIGPDTLVEVLV